MITSKIDVYNIDIQYMSQQKTYVNKSFKVLRVGLFTFCGIEETATGANATSIRSSVKWKIIHIISHRKYINQ